ARTTEKDAKMESGEETARVGLYEVKVVTLGADATDASLKVDSTPGRARLWIDGKDSGKTPGEGRLPLGGQTLQGKAEGDVDLKREVTLERRSQKEVTLAMNRVPEKPRFLSVAWTKRIGWTAAGVGLAGLGVGAVTGGLSLDQSKQIRQRCQGP